MKIGSEAKAQQAQTSSLSPSSTPRSPAGRNPRTARKVGVQATRLEAVDDSLGPLGPLGEISNASEPELPPAPPLKEQSLPVRNVRPTQSAQSPMSRSMIDSTELGDDDRSSVHSRQRYATAGGIETSRRQTQPSVSIEQAARPTFTITVGDQHKVGDLTSSHIVYQVRTKVRSLGLPIPKYNLINDRQLQKRTNSPNLLSVDVIETFYGFIIRYTIVTPVSWSPRHQRNRLWAVLIPILLNLEDQHLRRC